MVVFLTLLIIAFGLFGYFDGSLSDDEKMSDEGWNEKYNR